MRPSNHNALSVFSVGFVPDLASGGLARAARRRFRCSVLIAHADLDAPGSSPGSQGVPADDGPIHTGDGLSGSEHEVEPAQGAEDEPTDPEEAPSQPLGDEKHAIPIYVARNLTNCVDIQPLGTAWFSA